MCAAGGDNVLVTVVGRASDGAAGLEEAGVDVVTA
jgi:hypothetical protein